MSQSVLQNTPAWVLFLAYDSGTDAPRTGITFDQVEVVYKKSDESSFTAKPLLVGDFREIGLGVYEILFTAGELDTVGSFLYVVNGNGTLPPPAIKQYVGILQVQDVAAYTSGTITAPTNILTGNLINLAGQPLANETVTARMVATPKIMGVSPNIGGVGYDLLSAKTDDNGFFALEVLQGATVDIIIPAINYRRTLLVPTNVTDILFTLP